MRTRDLTEYAVHAGAARRASPGSARAARLLAPLLVAVLCLTITVMQASQDGQWAFWMSICVFFGLLLNILFFMRPRNDIFEPVVLVGGMFLLAFVVRGLFLHFNVDPTRVNPWVFSNLGLLGRMSAYTVAGFALFLLAYYAPPGRFLAERLPRMRTTWDMDLLGAKAIRVYCLCLPAKLMGILPAGAFAFQHAIMLYLGNIIGLMASLTDVALLLYGVYYYHHRKTGVIKGRMPFYIMLCIQLVAGFLTGYREPLFVSLLALVFVRHYVWSPVKLRTVIAGFLGLMLVVTPVSRAYRQLAWVERQAPLKVVENLSSQVAVHMDKHPAAGRSLWERYGLNSLMNISNRLHGADSVITCLATVPRYMQYQKGETLYLLPVTVFVPRALWPEKPKIGLGTFFKENIWRGPTNQSQSGGQIAITQMGELYINFGLWGILIGMALLGVFHRFAYSYAILGHEQGSYTVLLFYFACVLCFLAIERNFAFSYGYLLKLFVFLYFLARYLNKGPVFART